MRHGGPGETLVVFGDPIKGLRKPCEGFTIIRPFHHDLQRNRNRAHRKK
jgi:hypothetical protein